MLRTHKLFGVRTNSHSRKIWTVPETEGSIDHTLCNAVHSHTACRMHFAWTTDNGLSETSGLFKLKEITPCLPKLKRLAVLIGGRADLDRRLVEVKKFHRAEGKKKLVSADLIDVETKSCIAPRFSDISQRLWSFHHYRATRSKAYVSINL